MTHVIVAGAGYAGLQAASAVAMRCGGRCVVTIVDQHENHQLITRLPELVGGTIDVRKASIPYNRILSRGVTRLRSEVTALDPENIAIQTRAGRLQGDYLVIALGSAADFRSVPGAREHAFPVRSISEAEALRRRLEQVTAQRDRVRVVIVGAGYTGTEVAGQLAEWSRRRGGTRAVSITVVAPEDRLLSEGDPRLGIAAERILRKKGVRFRLRHGVTAVERDRVLVEPGEPCEADVVIWAARAHAAPPGLPGIAALAEGRVAVDPYLRVARYDRVYLVGDVAAPYDFRRNRVTPPSAQMAVEEGAVAGSNIAALVTGRKPREFRPRVLGEALALGGPDGVAEVQGVILTGLTAIAVKKVALVRYLQRIGGSRLVRDYI